MVSFFLDFTSRNFKPQLYKFKSFVSLSHQEKFLSKIHNFFVQGGGMMGGVTAKCEKKSRYLRTIVFVFHIFWNIYHRICIEVFVEKFFNLAQFSQMFFFLFSNIKIHFMQFFCLLLLWGRMGAETQFWDAYFAIFLIKRLEYQTMKKISRGVTTEKCVSNRTTKCQANIRKN